MNFNLQDYIAIYTAKAGALASRILGNNGTNAPGVIASKISPNILKKYLNSTDSPPIYITGTNGKSTTAGILASVHEQTNQNLIHNLSGANLISGILSIFVNSTPWIVKQNYNQAIFEIDEAYIKHITPLRKPGQIIVTNFFRDQLDRFGELETTISLVQRGVNHLDGQLIANVDDPNVNHLHTDNIVYFGINSKCFKDNDIHSSELATCPKCGAEISYNKQWLGQFGDFYCKNCNYIKPKAQIEIIDLNITPNHSTFTVNFNNKEQHTFTCYLPGLFNVYNALAAISSAYASGIPIENIQEGLKSYTPLFGRSQEIQYKGNKAKLFLIKNPIGASEVLRLISTDPKARILIVINDNYADGRDISWLWDAYFEYLQDLKTKDNIIYTAGTRGSDIAVRLKYIDIRNIEYNQDWKESLDNLIEEKDTDENIYILPTYTALLDITKTLKLEMK